MRIVFLGQNLNILSMACLRALIADGSHSLLVGIEERRPAGLLKTLRRAYRSKGLRFVIVRSLARCRAKVHTAARKLGVGPSGYESLREMIKDLGLEGFDGSRLQSAETLERIRGATPDLIVVAAFSQILKSSVIGIPRLGAINLHPSLLPRYRGPNPFYWVLKNGEPRTGVTVHYIDEGIDTGDIILQREMRVSPGHTERTLLKASSEAAGEIVVEAVQLISEGSAKRIPQDADDASYYTTPPRGASLL